MITVKNSFFLRILAGLLTGLLLLPGAQAEDDISFVDFSIRPSEQRRVLITDVQLDYRLGDYLRSGLLNGMTLESELLFMLEWHNTWWWNTQKPLASIKMRLKYHPLSQQYQVIRLNDKQHWNFPNLVTALEKMGKLSNYRLPPLPENALDNDAAVFVTAKLRPESLNLPLKMHSLFSDRYSLETTYGVMWPIP